MTLVAARVPAVFLALALLFGGCGNQEGGSQDGLPSSFPLPAGSEIIKSEPKRTGDSVTCRAEIEVQLDRQALRRFFEAALPEAGWRVCTSLESNANVLILFSVSGCTEPSSSVSIRNAQDDTSLISVYLEVIEGSN